MATLETDYSGWFLKPFTKKAYDFAFRNPADDKLFNVLWGTVRSSKTWAVMVKFLQLLSYRVDGHNVIFGKTKQTIKNNFLDNLFTLCDRIGWTYNYNRQSGELNVMGVPWLVYGANDDRAEGNIRGLTIGRAIGDELVLCPPSFLKMLQNRMSVSGARFYGTTNTDTPFHYVKTDILDRLSGSDLLWEEKFTLDDNPHNRPGYKADLEKMFPPGSLYHQRFVLGLWVTGEGSIYKDVWRENCLYDDEPWQMTDGKPGRVTPPALRQPGGHVARYVPVDYGTDHPQVYLDILDDGDDVWIDREYVWDSHVTMRQKTDLQYREDLQEFLQDAPNGETIIPPECASFEAELVQSGIWFTMADNDVLDGIRTVSSLMALGKLHVHRRCKRLREGIETYVWDANAAKRGVEQPLKQKDDAVDCLRYGIRSKIAAWRLAA